MGLSCRIAREDITGLSQMVIEMSADMGTTPICPALIFATRAAIYAIAARKNK
jgi:hypothetical protein